MSNDCCNERPNFGHPACIEDLGGVSRFIFVPMGTNYNLVDDLVYQAIVDNFTDILNVPEIWAPFPEVENFVWTPAESQFEESSNGKKSWIKNGKTSIACESWDGNATAKMVAKMEALRCAQWGILLVTDSNKLIGSSSLKAGEKSIKPIAIDEQSIQALFQFKTDATTQKIMFSFDLARNFDVSTLYAIDGDLIWDATSEAVKPIDFNNDLPNVVDCQLAKNGAFITTGGAITVNDDYRQGTRNVAAGDSVGNVTGLVIGNFLVENLTDATTVTPTSVTENGTGVYEFVLPAQTSGDIVKISLAIPAQTELSGQYLYQGNITITIP
jgi:hypothetical protein